MDVYERYIEEPCAEVCMSEVPDTSPISIAYVDRKDEMSLLSHNINLITFPELPAMSTEQVGGNGLIELSHFRKNGLGFIKTLVDKSPLFCICSRVST